VSFSARVPPFIGSSIASSTSRGPFVFTSWAISFANAANSPVFATKSVSQLTSTSVPKFPSTWATTSPSEAIRDDFLAAAASPFLRRKSIAPSMSPPAEASAALQSIRPAPVFSRSSLTIPDVISMPRVLPGKICG